MSLVGRPAKNHPLQVRANGARDAVDDRWTPLHLWIPWHERWQFTLDVAASHDNYLCGRYFTLEDDGLAQSWRGERVWCNPPYSDLPAWVAKASSEADGCPVIVMLLPANRTEQRWWQEHIEPYRDSGGTLTTEFLPRRINFGSRDNLGAWSASSAPFGCVLVTWHGARDGGEP